MVKTKSSRIINMKEKFHLEPSDISNEIIIISNIVGRSHFISTIIKQKKLNNSILDDQYNWLKENHPEYLI
jgi:hypothetical protein